MFNDCIIMAGGTGTRLWPASTSLKPKQFLKLPSEPAPKAPKSRSFFSTSVERALAVTGKSGDGRIIIVAGKNHIDAIVEECAGFSIEERERMVLIPEPMAKNTAPAIACALLYIEKTLEGSERKVLVLTSDHIIGPLNVFRADANAALAFTQKDNLVVFGIPPLGPETGYGYIECSGALAMPEGKNTRSRRYRSEAFSVASFQEKPDIKKAKKYITSKKYYWNSGMFAFSSKFMIREFGRYSPDLINPINELGSPKKQAYLFRKGLKILQKWDNLETAYQKTRAISFDYAIAEKCRAAVMIKAGFSWLDVGSWDDYARFAGNTRSLVYGAREAKETCFVDSDIPVALCGVEDLIIVVRSGRDGRPAAVLAAKKGETQRIREIVEEIKASGRSDLI